MKYEGKGTIQYWFGSVTLGLNVRFKTSEYTKSSEYVNEAVNTSRKEEKRREEKRNWSEVC